MKPLERLASARNHFELFSLPVRFTLDRQSLDARYLELAQQTHPDRHGDDPERLILAIDLSARVNAGYAILQDDLRRAEHVAEVRGGDLSAARPDQAVIERVFEYRDALSSQPGRADEPREGLQAWYEQLMQEIGRRLDDDASAETGRTCQLIAEARYVRRALDAAK